MSMIPDKFVCPRCDRYIGLPNVGRQLSSAGCVCDELDAKEVKEGATFAVDDRNGRQRIIAVTQADAFTVSLATIDDCCIPRAGYHRADLERLIAKGDARPVSVLPA